MKVLMSAYACCPGQGSEPGVGWNWALQAARWNWALQAARFHEVWVLTREKNREAIEAARPPNLHPVYVDLPKWARLWKRGRWAIWPYYHLWQRKAGRVAQRLHREVGFDLAHHVTFCSIHSVTELDRFPIPLVVGPLGGAERAPRDLLREPLRRAAVKAAARRPAFIRNLRAAACVLASNSDTTCWLHRLAGGKVRLLPQIGVDSGLLAAAEREHRGTEGRVFFGGGLVRRKGLPLALEAMRHARAASLTVAGGGPLEGELRRTAARLGIDSRTAFLGSIPRRELQERLRKADIFLFPSLRDSAGMVVLEAMAAGLPIVCLDLGGPGMLVTDECGIKIRPGTREQVVRDMAAAIDKLATSPDLRRRMGGAGRQRVIEHFDWDRKGERMNAIYKEVVSRKG